MDASNSSRIKSILETSNLCSKYLPAFITAHHLQIAAQMIIRVHRYHIKQDDILSLLTAFIVVRYTKKNTVVYQIICGSLYVVGGYVSKLMQIKIFKEVN